MFLVPLNMIIFTFNSSKKFLQRIVLIIFFIHTFQRMMMWMPHDNFFHFYILFIKIIATNFLSLKFVTKMNILNKLIICS